MINKLGQFKNPKSAQLNLKLTWTQKLFHAGQFERAH